MKKIFREFVRRGFSACGIGPVVLAVIYLVFKQKGLVEMLSINQVCIGIFSLTALAFVAGGMNVIYQIERFSLMTSVTVHGVVLYIGYLFTYLVNDWLERGLVSIMVFTGIFIVGYLTIWAIIYSIIKKKTAKLNKMLKEKQSETLIN